MLYKLGSSNGTFDKLTPLAPDASFLPTAGAEGPVEVLEAAAQRLAEVTPTGAGRPS